MKLPTTPRAFHSDGQSRDYSEGWAAAVKATLEYVAEDLEEAEKACLVRADNPLRAKSTSAGWRRMAEAHRRLADRYRKAAKLIR